MSRSAAIHEAAHAVIARVLGLSCGKVTLEPETRIRGERDGSGKVVFVHEPGPLAHAEISRRSYASVKYPGAGTKQACDEAFVIQLYAGHEAECLICGEAEHNDTHDREDAAAILGDALHREAELRRKARELVVEHRAMIEQVATALLEHRTLYGMQVHMMMGLDG